MIGYLHESLTRRILYLELFKKLLNAWSTKASIVNTSHEQHLYLTKCILICVSYMDANDKDPMANGKISDFFKISLQKLIIYFKDLLKPILNGVEKHLCSPIVRMQTLGMIVGENLMNDLVWAEQHEDLKKLKFEVKKWLKKITLIKIITSKSRSGFKVWTNWRSKMAHFVEK